MTKPTALKMPLRIKTVTPESGRPYVALVDDDGVVVPCQVATLIECSADNLPVFTAQFVVDGEDLILS